MRPTLFDCLTSHSIAPVLAYLDALPAPDRLRELELLLDETDGEQLEEQLLNGYRLAILKHYRELLFRPPNLSDTGRQASKPEVGEVGQSEREMEELYEQIRVVNLPVHRYVAIAGSVVARVVQYYFYAGEYAQCRSFIEELCAQRRFQDLSNIKLYYALPTEDYLLFPQGLSSNNEAAEEVAMELDSLLDACLEGVEVVRSEVFDLIPSYSSKKKLDAYFHTPCVRIPVGMLPNPNLEVEDTLKLFLNRRDGKGLMHYVDYQLTEFEQCEQRVEAGHLETCYLIMVLLHYYDFLGAHPDLEALVQQLCRRLVDTLYHYRPRYRSL